MSVVQSFPVHVFCHADLNTTDVQAARNFYGTLLGWHFTETQLEGWSVHNMDRIDGHAVTGLGQLPHTLEAGMRPSWALYVMRRRPAGLWQPAKRLGALLSCRCLQWKTLSALP